MNKKVLSKLYSELFGHPVRFPGVEEDFFINIEIPDIPNNEDLINIKKNGPNRDINNLPIFIVQSHGSINSEITLNSRNKKGQCSKENKEGCRKIEFSRDSDLFKLSSPGEWIIYNSPVGDLGISSSYDDKFVKYINNNIQITKNRLFSDNPKQILSLKSYIQRDNESFFCPPSSIYSDKTHYFFDEPERDDTYMWSMGILPIFKDNLKQEDFPIFNYSKEEFENETEHDLYSRIFNNFILDRLNWLKSPRGTYGNIQVSKPVKKRYWWPSIPKEWKDKRFISLKERYQYMTEVINYSLPILNDNNYYSHKRKGIEDWYGKGILMSEIMSVLGPGIYISLSCSPFVDYRSLYLKKEYLDEPHVINRNIKLRVFEDIISKFINPLSLQRWQSIFPKKKFSIRKTKKAKTRLIIERDNEAGPVATTSIAVGHRRKKTKKKKKYKFSNL